MKTDSLSPMKAIFLLVLLVIAFSAEAGDITVSTDSLTSSSSLRRRTEEISLDDHDHEISLLKIQVGALMTQLGLLDQQVHHLEGGSQPCTGITPLSTNWIAYSGGGMYVDVDTSACGFDPGTKPKYFTSMTGKSSHWKMTGATSIYSNKHDSFRIYISTDSVTAAQAKGSSYRWRIQWVAFPENTV